MKALVTGATGFLGGALVRRLLADGWEVVATGRQVAAGEALAAAGAQFVRADLTDAARIFTATAGCDTLFHCGALSSPWGPHEAFVSANVLGTQNLVAAATSHRVRRFVHVSTPSLYFDYRDREMIREDEPLPPHGVNSYAQTKREAEKIVDASGLATVTIRPRALFGPGDTTILPRLIRANAKGFLPLIGGGRARVDVTYVDNVVEALLLAAQADGHAIGKKYNVTNGEPMALMDLLAKLFKRLEMPMNGRPVPFAVAHALATALEAGSRLTGGPEPILTRYTVGLLARTQTLDLTAIRRDLGYEPKVSIDEGLERFATWWEATNRG